MYSEDECLDFYLCYVENRRSYALTVREYHDRFPERQIPDRKTVQRIERNLRNHGVIKYNKRNKPRNVLTEDTQLNISLYFEENPENSLNDAKRDLAIPRSTIHDSMKINKYKPFKFAKLQHLEPHDNLRRLEFCMNMMERHFEDNIFERICWTDEAIFTTAGEYNRKNVHYWSNENKKKVKPIKRQGRRSVHVWCGIYRNQIIGPIFMERNLNRQSYLNLLQEDIFPMLAADEELDQITFQMDGAPCHNSAEVGEVLNNNFAGVIGPNGTVFWPPRSPDLTPMDYFVWGTLKDMVYESRCECIEELKQRIRVGIQFLNRSGSVERAVRKLQEIYTTCILQDGGHVENLL